MNPIIFAYGGGTNSAAILVELIKREITAPHDIVFADTGAEKPNTYEHIKIMSQYSVGHGYPPITVVKNNKASRYGGLEQMCLHHKAMPSIAYGFKTCSMIFKIEPMNDYIYGKYGKNSPHTRIIGYDLDEKRRIKNADGKEDEFQTNWYPLVEWGMGRDECIQSIKDAGLPLPGKSSCFFCPNSRPHEIKKLAEEYPDLMERALAIERVGLQHSREQGKAGEIYGLGRNYAWANLIATDDMFSFLDIQKSMPCGCYDGDDDEG